MPEIKTIPVNSQVTPSKCPVQRLVRGMGARAGWKGGCPVMGMMRSARCVRGALGFTLIEVLVTTGIIAVLISVLIPSLSKARSVARQTREVASGQQVMTAFHAYATDDKDRVLTGFASPAMVNGNMIVRDATGQRLHSATGRIEEAQRYPFRIAPYFNYDFSGLYHDPAQLRDWVNNPENYLNYGRDLTYMLSLYPSLGMNVAFVGGSDQLGQFDPIFQKIFGRVYVDRLPDVRRPSGLMAFGSARGVAPPGMEIGQLPEGFFRIEPPYYSGAQGRRWATAYEKGSPVPGLNSGFVSLRHAGKGVVAYVDGHVGVAGWSEFEDMRLWADKADSPTWAIQPQ